MPDEPLCSMNRPLFFRKAYHNMRNPIVVIKGYTSLMLDGCGGELSEDQREWVQDMKNNVEHLLLLINNLAELSFVEAGIAEKEKTTVRLDDVVDSVVKELEEGTRKKQLTVEILKAGDIPAFEADNALIARALGNLIHNAVLYAPEGSTVGISLARENGNALFSVTDKGPGIEEEHLAKVQEGFSQGGEPPEDYKGTGLGLLISRRIAELYGGGLQIQSTPGEGTTVTLSFRL